MEGAPDDSYLLSPLWQLKMKLMDEVINGYSVGAEHSVRARSQYDQLRIEHPEVYLHEAGADFSFDDIVGQMSEDISGFDL